jgi:hypothetical protein
LVLEEAIQFEEPMHECVRLLGEIKNAIKRRGDKWQNLLNGTADLHAKQAAYQKVVGVPGKEDIATSKLVLVETAQERVETAQTELDDVTKQLLEEVASFKINKAIEFKSACREFVKVLITLNDNTEKVWKELQPSLQVVSRNAPKEKSNSKPFKEVDQSPKTRMKKEDIISFESPTAPAFQDVEQDKYEEEDAPPPPNPSNFMNEIDIEDEDDEAGV